MMRDVKQNIGLLVALVYEPNEEEGEKVMGIFSHNFTHEDMWKLVLFAFTN